MSPLIARRTVLLGAGALGAGLAVTPLPAAAGTNSRQLAFLNHSYTVLDRETADAVADNAYLKTFGDFQLRTTSNGSQTYTGRYLLGRQTYLEIFGPGDLPAPDDTRGSTGLALSPDRAGGIVTIKQRMVDLGATEPLDLVQTKAVGGAQIPWYRVVAPTTAYAAAFPWVMEYRRSYFADPRTASEPGSGPDDVSRERYNPDLYRGRLMRDVVGLEFGAVAADVPAIVIDMKAAGLRVRQHDGYVLGVGRSELITVRTVSRTHAGWRRIGFALNRSVRNQHVESIGRSTLRVGPGPQAVWSFAA